MLDFHSREIKTKTLSRVEKLISISTEGLSTLSLCL